MNFRDLIKLISPKNLQTLSAESENKQFNSEFSEKLIFHLSLSHFVELIEIENTLRIH